MRLHRVPWVDSGCRVGVAVDARPRASRTSVAPDLPLGDPHVLRSARVQRRGDVADVERCHGPAGPSSGRPLGPYRPSDGGAGETRGLGGHSVGARALAGAGCVRPVDGHRRRQRIAARFRSDKEERCSTHVVINKNGSARGGVLSPAVTEVIIDGGAGGAPPPSARARRLRDRDHRQQLRAGGPCERRQPAQRGGRTRAC